jgi:hypothetical protein
MTSEIFDMIEEWTLTWEKWEAFQVLNGVACHAGREEPSAKDAA